jgi:4-alpha-glucanotransferase
MFWEERTGMKKVNLLFGIHNHQPIGNFDFVFADAYEKSYLPFLQVLDRFPEMKIGLHFSGILLDWLEENRPELIKLVSKMVKRGQIEILTGGHYEPILSIIPEKDRIGQIKKLSKRIKKLFNYDPIGMWLAERVWEPTLPSSLKKAGVIYTIADDTHFKYAGLTENQLTGYFITEDLGNRTILFPISKKLRYTIPFEDPQVTIDYLREMATEKGENLIVFADDGEKFGVWPNTFDHVFTNGWLEHFFEAITENRDWINVLHFKEALELYKPLDKIYLPTASYSEMMHWSLFPGTFQAYEDFEHYLKTQDFYEDVHVFVRGGFWRNFLSKYSEVNDMHKKMLRVSEKYWSISAAKRKKLVEASDALWSGQCNCPYWHGVFGGLYLSHLRDAIYSNLIKAEILVDDALGTKFPLIEKMDLNADGYDEILVETKHYNAYIHPGKGAYIYELDHKPTMKNVFDTMTRRREGYHNKLDQAVAPGSEKSKNKTASIHDLILAKEPDLVSKLHYDFYERKSFIEHFVAHDTTPESFAAAKFIEEGDFYNSPYNIISEKKSANSVDISLERNGQLKQNKQITPIKIIKSYKFRNKSAKISVNYSIENLTKQPVKIWFGVELNFGLQAGHAHDRYYYCDGKKLKDKYLDSIGKLNKVNSIGLRDEWRNLDILIETDKLVNIWRCPVETISLSEAGFERVYQNSTVFPNIQIKLDKKFEMEISLSLSKIK